MHTDRQGNPVTGANATALEAYEGAVRALNVFHGDPVALIDEARAAAPDFVMAHVFKAWIFGLATEPAATEEARRIIQDTRTLPMSERERSHVAALDLLLANEWTQACTALDWHSMSWPLDIVALQAGHLADFYRANARNLRDRIARALPKWSENTPGHSVLLGMYAFGLEESGDYARAEAFGREATAREPLDSWAHHAVAHVMEMQGRAEDGLGWMAAREPYWSSDDDFFQVHNWWHKALYHLELGQQAEALALYDDRIRGRTAIALDLVDASALLWRLQAEGCDVGDRWSAVAVGWEAHADGSLYPFNDFHAVMAYASSERMADAMRLAAVYRDSEPQNEVRRWAQATGLPLIEGFIAFAKGDYETAVARLHPARHIVNCFGGSHAQRDVIDWTLMEAAIRGGMGARAEALAGERLAAKPHSPLNRRFLQRAEATGMRQQAAE